MWMLIYAYNELSPRADVNNVTLIVSRQWILPSKHHCTRVLLGEPFRLQIFCLKKVLESMQLIYMDIYMPIVGKEAFLLERHGVRKLQQLVEQIISL
nr:hypothetical protein [Tanacetum cinerariifolium]